MVDAFIILLLVAEASMIFPALNWWPHPVQWFRSLTNIDRFTLVLAIFTALLALATCIQVWAFIQGERAVLVVDNMSFRTGEPTTDRPTYGMKIKNPGKSVATIQEFSASTYLGLHNHDLSNDALAGSAASGSVISTLRVGCHLYLAPTF